MNTKITYRLATLEDSESIRKFLRQHYYPEEPMNIAIKINFEQEFNDEEFNISNIAHGACVIAVNDCKQIVGVTLAAPKYPDTEERLLEAASQIPNTKWENVLLFCAAVERNSNVYKKYGIDKAIHGLVVAVDKTFRGNGIGLKLIVKSMEKARELGFPLYTIDCTSVYSAQVCERLDMDCVNESAFADYRAPNSNAQVFFPPGDHKVVKSYAKKLL